MFGLFGAFGFGLLGKLGLFGILGFCAVPGAGAGIEGDSQIHVLRGRNREGLRKIGRAGVAFDLSRATVTIGPTVLFEDGQPHDEAAPRAAEYLKRTEIDVSVGLGAGSATSTVWTCDLSAEYVRINADYRT